MKTPPGIWLVVLALVLVACGGSPSGDGSDTTTGQDSEAEGTSGEAEASSSQSEGEADTLAAFFGWDTGEDPAAMQAEFLDQEARIQEEIRQCMAEQGFDYQPVMPPEDRFGVVEEIDHEEWVRQYGFGISTYFGSEEEVTATTMMTEEAWVDPNQEKLEAMSESERQAWYDALFGTEEEQMEDTEVEIDEETGETIYYGTGFGAGCQGKAYEAVHGDPAKTEELWLQLQPAMDEMYQRIEADQRIVDANAEWAACMKDAGYAVTTRQAIWETVYEDFQQRFDEIVGPNGGFADPFEGWTEDEINAFFEEKSPEEVDRFFAEAERAAREDIDMDALKALQQEEIDMAVADLECGEGLDELYMEVSQEYEADFISANREILEQIREAEGR